MTISPDRFARNLTRASTAIRRYEAMSRRPRKSVAWRALAERIFAAAAYERHTGSPMLASLLVDLAKECQEEAFVAMKEVAHVDD